MESKSVCIDLAVSPVGWGAVKGSLDKLRASGDEFARFVVSQLKELDALWAEIGERHRRLDDERRKLAELRAELVRQREHAALVEAQARETMRERQSELEAERAGLEAELESVRKRVATLAEEAAYEKKCMAEERAEWSGELRQLRRALEKQLELLADHPASGGAHVRPEPTRGPSEAAADDNAATDPLIESIMAQFDQLQKDLSLPCPSTKKSAKHVVA